MLKQQQRLCAPSVSGTESTGPQSPAPCSKAQAHNSSSAAGFSVPYCSSFRSSNLHRYQQCSTRIPRKRQKGSSTSHSAFHASHWCLYCHLQQHIRLQSHTSCCQMAQLQCSLCDTATASSSCTHSGWSHTQKLHLMYTCPVSICL